MAPWSGKFVPEPGTGDLPSPNVSRPTSAPRGGLKPGQYRPSHGSGSKWRKIIEKFASVDENSQIQQGPWDPYPKFKTFDAVQAFFNGFQIPLGKDKLIYREKFARWAIGEALKGYGPDSFHVTGDFMRNEMVRYRLGSNKTLPKKIMDAIRADGQQDVDAEDPNPVIKKDGEAEFGQSIGGAAQALISASPNCLGPPIQPCATYLQMKKVGNYGRNQLSVWNSPLFPEVKIRTVERYNEQEEEEEEPVFKRRFRGHRNKVMVNTKPLKKSSKGFLDSQVTAIVWILSRLLGKLPKLVDKETFQEKENRRMLRGPKYGGAILADSMGLGKTLTAIASIELMVRHKLNVGIDPDTGKKMHCPILILCPNVTVTAQWVEEILQSTSANVIKTIIVSGGSSKHYPYDYRVKHFDNGTFDNWPLSHGYVWNKDDPRASKTIIAMPIDTWAARTCHVVLEKEDDDENEVDHDTDEIPVWHSTLTDDHRYFSIVCIDEAHKVKNASTKVFKSVSLLKKQFTILITATPCLNTLTDLLGLARLLWDTAKDYLQSSPGIWGRIEAMTQLEDLEKLEGLEPYDDLQLAAGRPSLLTRLLGRDRRGNGHDIEQTRKYLCHFEKLAMLKRGPGSFIFEDWEKTRSVSLEGLFPAVDNWTVNIEMEPTLAARYQFAHVQLLTDYVQTLNNWSEITSKKDNKESPAKSDYKPLATIHRQWQIASSSMDVFKIDKLFRANNFGTMAEHITQMRNAGITFPQLAKFLLEPEEPTPSTALDYLKVAIRGSPTLRFILHDFKENVLDRKRGEKLKKLLITEATPILAYYYEMVLQFIGINCRVFHADLSQDQRKELVESFNHDAMDSVQVLIQMYTVAFAGTNLHKSCARVIVASQAHSLAVQWQAIHRVIRVGQTQDVKVFRLKVKNSYHAFRESRQVEKILPELGARAQGEMNNILVQLLNLFQYEVEDAWRSKEGQRLLAERDLLSPLSSEPVTPTPITTKSLMGSALAAPKPAATIRAFANLVGSKNKLLATVLKRKNEDGLNLHTDKKQKLGRGDGDITGMKFRAEHSKTSEKVWLSSEESEDSEDLETSAGFTSVSIPSTTTTTTLRKGSLPDKYERKKIPGGAGWFNHVACENENDAEALEIFLTLKPRKEYYEEFKMLPKTKSHFDHRKNQLRRLLSFSAHDEDGYIPEKWTLEDLDDPAVLERALELMLRIRLGAGPIDMMPFPHINFSQVPPKKLKTLLELIAQISHTDQDIEVARSRDEAKKAKDGLKEYIPGINHQLELSEIDEKLKNEVKYAGAANKSKLKREKEKSVKKCPNSNLHVTESPYAELSKEKQDEDDDHAEGEEPDSDDEDNITIPKDDLYHSKSHALGKGAGAWDSDENKVDMAGMPTVKNEDSKIGHFGNQTPTIKEGKKKYIKDEDAKFDSIIKLESWNEELNSLVNTKLDLSNSTDPFGSGVVSSQAASVKSEDDFLPSRRALGSFPGTSKNAAVKKKPINKSMSYYIIDDDDEASNTEQRHIKRESKSKSVAYNTDMNDEVTITGIRTIKQQPGAKSAAYSTDNDGDVCVVKSKKVKREVEVIDDSDDDIVFLRAGPSQTKFQ